MQSSKQSAIETVIGTMIGFIVSVLIWEFVVKPVWDIHTAFIENISITLLFTIASILRGYVVRRLFNRLHTNKNKKVANDTLNWNHGLRPGGER